jgi:hypothetical protein
MSEFDHQLWSLFFGGKITPQGTGTCRRLTPVLGAHVRQGVFAARLLRIRSIAGLKPECRRRRKLNVGPRLEAAVEFSDLVALQRLGVS